MGSEAQTKDGGEAVRRRARAGRRILWVLSGVAAAGVGVVAAGDWIYARAVEHRYRRWEKGIERDADGVRVNCREFSLGEGEIGLLLIHGYGDSPVVFAGMAKALAERGYACRAMRLPGFAEPMEVYQQTNRHQWREAVDGEVERLAADHRRVWLVGHSAGGALAIQQVLAADRRVDGVVLLAPVLEVSSQRSPVLATRQWFDFGQRFLRRTRVYETVFPVDAHDPAARAYPYRDKFVPVTVVENLYLLVDDLCGQAPQITIPVLMVLAENDRVVDNAAARAYFAALGSPRRQMLEQPLAGHMLPLDTGWTNLVETIDSFIRGDGAPAGE